MKEKLFIVGCTLLAMCLAASLFGQQNPVLTSAYHVKIKPGMGPAATSALAAHAQWRTQQGDPWSWRVYEVATGDSLGDIIIRSSDHTWADFDSYSEFLAKGAIHFNAVMGPVMESISHTIDRAMPQVSNWPEGTQAALVSVTEFSLDPSKAREVQESIATVHRTLQEAAWKRAYSWHATVSGASESTMAVAIPFANWAGMDTGDNEMMRVLIEAHGEEKATAVMRNFASGVRESRNFVVRFRPDLSVNVQ